MCELSKNLRNVTKEHAVFKTCLTALLMFLGTCASAMSPESGIWWNPNESGSGYVIEIQDNTLSFTTYTYEPNGIPLWV